MPTGKPKIVFFYGTASAALRPPTCISLKKYQEKYFLSRKQIKRLLAKKLICAVRFKRRLYIADSAPRDI
jgi:hypothetical protein